MFYLCGTACAAANKVRKGKGIIVVGVNAQERSGGLPCLLLLQFSALQWTFSLGS